MYKVKILKFINFIIFFSLIFFLILYIFHGILSIKYKYQLDGGEGFILYEAKLLSEFKNIYIKIDDYPFLVANYPPIYPFINSLLIPLFGVNYISGRLISFLSTLLGGFFIFKILRKIGVSNLLSIGGGAIYISNIYIYYWSVFYRVDSLGILFTLLGVYFALEENKKSLFLTTLFFILAIFTKQTFISAPLALSLYYIYQKKFTLLKRFLISFLGGGAFIFLIFNILTDGNFFLHLIKYNANEYSLNRLIKYQIAFLKDFRYLLTSLFIGIIFLKRKIDFLFFYLILSGLSTLSVGKVGSYINYFNEFIAVISIFIAYIWEKSKKGIKDKSYPIISFLILFLLLFHFIQHIKKVNDDPRYNIIKVEESLEEDLKNNEAILKYVKEISGDIISDDPTYLIFNNKEVIFQSFIFAKLAEQSIWDQERFLNDIRAQKFEIIILPFDIKNPNWKKCRYTKEMIEEINTYYSPQLKFGINYIYKRRILAD